MTVMRAAPEPLVRIDQQLSAFGSVVLEPALEVST